VFPFRKMPCRVIPNTDSGDRMPKNRTNTLLIGDTLYELTEAYRNGARACRAETPFWANPHRDGSQRHADWAAGHDNEAAGHHRVTVTLDAIEAAPAGLELIAPEEEVLEPVPAASAYRAFTAAHDEVVRAVDLIASDPAKHIGIRGALDSLSLDSDAFWDEASRVEARASLDVFRATLPDGLRSRPLILLLDNSGSMRGQSVAALVGVLGEMGGALDQAGIPFEVLGFTTRSWKGGRAREDWILGGRPHQPGRLCELRHVIYKDAAEPWNPDLLGLMLMEGFLKENVDGEALLWAAERGRQLGGATILHVTDGKPMDDSTLSANPADYLDRHLETVSRQIGADPDLTLIRGDISDPKPLDRKARQESKLTHLAQVLVEATLQAIAAPRPERDSPQPDGP
jgi:hypothetical protein